MTEEEEERRCSSITCRGHGRLIVLGIIDAMMEAKILAALDGQGLYRRRDLDEQKTNEDNVLAERPALPYEEAMTGMTEDSTTSAS